MFLAEGPQAVREALRLPGCVLELFATSAVTERHAELIALAADEGIDVAWCDERAIATLTSSVTPQGLVARCRFVDVPLAEALHADSRLVVVAAHVRDPGNAGTLVRCGDAVAADAVVFAGSSVDPYNEKVVRASVGSIFHLPLVTGTTVSAAVQQLKDRGFLVVGADGNAPTTLDGMLDAGRLAGRVAWIFGNEAWGVPAGELALADEVVAVPIYGKAESLNVAAAAAVCLYTTARAQRGPAA
jgi:TrmH family RNA methyltransferase